MKPVPLSCTLVHGPPSPPRVPSRDLGPLEQSTSHLGCGTVSFFVDGAKSPVRPSLVCKDKLVSLPPFHQVHYLSFFSQRNGPLCFSGLGLLFFSHQRFPSRLLASAASPAGFRTSSVFFVCLASPCLVPSPYPSFPCHGPIRISSARGKNVTIDLFSPPAPCERDPLKRSPSVFCVYPPGRTSRLPEPFFLLRPRPSSSHVYGQSSPGIPSALPPSR